MKCVLTERFKNDAKKAFTFISVFIGVAVSVVLFFAGVAAMMTGIGYLMVHLFHLCPHFPASDEIEYYFSAGLAGFLSIIATAGALWAIYTSLTELKKISAGLWMLLINIKRLKDYIFICK